MGRRSGDLVDRTKRPRARENAIAVRPEDLSPAKRRIAEALAALLVAHHRRQEERPDPRRDPVP